MEAFKINREEYAKEQFMRGKDFEKVISLLPHEEDEDLKENYEGCFKEATEEDINLDNYVDELREGFKYLYGQYPENLTEKDIEGLTIETVRERIEAAMEALGY